MKKTRKRKPKPDDQDKSQEAFELMKLLAISNPHIDINQFVGACFSVWADRHQSTGFSYKEFIKETERAAKHVKHWWGKDENKS